MPKPHPRRSVSATCACHPVSRCRKSRLPSGWAYVFRHTELGLLGGLVLQSLSSGHCQVSCEVAGDPADPLTARRRQVLDP